MAGPEKDVTDQELKVLEALWALGPSTVRQLAGRLYPGGKAAHLATVQTLLTRLEGKGCVQGDRSQRPHVFKAVADREALIGRRLRDTAEKLCGGSMTPLLVHLLESEPISEAQRAELRAVLEHLKKGVKK
jgi:predicted transcriptional regulator